MKYKDQISSKERHCELQRQQATVEVYTRFYIQTPKLTDYFMGSSAFLKVTDLVASRLRMSDTRIATLTGNIIKGKEDGRTEIQVQYPVEISYEPPIGKTNNVVSDQVRHKPTCTSTEKS